MANAYSANCGDLMPRQPMSQNLLTLQIPAVYGWCNLLQLFDVRRLEFSAS